MGKMANDVVGIMATVLFLLFLSPTVGLPQECSRLVEATGEASVRNNDEAEARDFAILAAKCKAVESVGVYVNRETFYLMSLQVADWLTIKAGGYVKHYEVLSGSGRDGDRYRVNIKAWVKCGEEEKDEDINLLSLRKILIIAHGPGSDQLEGKLADRLSKLGYQYHDSSYVKSNVSNVSWNRLKDRQLFDLDQDVFKFMADLVILLDSRVRFAGRHGNFAFFRGDGRIRLYQLSGERRGEPVIDVTRSSNTLVGLWNGDADLAMEEMLAAFEHPNGFLRQIGEPSVSEFMERLLDNPVFQVRDQRVTVTLHKVPSRAEMKKFIAFVNRLSAVNSTAREEKQQGQTYIISLQFPLKMRYLVNFLSANPNYRLTAHDLRSVELRYAAKEVGQAVGVPDRLPNG